MKDQLKMILFVVILGSIAAAILVGTNGFTKDMIEENQDYALKSTILKAFEINYTEDAVVSVFEENIVEEEKDGMTFYYSKDGNVGFSFEGKGLWGPIRGFLTMETDFVTIKGIQNIYY